MTPIPPSKRTPPIPHKSRNKAQIERDPADQPEQGDGAREKMQVVLQIELDRYRRDTGRRGEAVQEHQTARIEKEGATSLSWTRTDGDAYCHVASRAI